MRRTALGLAVHNSHSSEELVRRVVEGLVESAVSDVDLHMLHVCVVYPQYQQQPDDRVIKQAVKFVSKRLQKHLCLLPPSCTWHVHVLVLRRPVYARANDHEQMCAYALCRKAARLGCSELIIKGKGPDTRFVPVVVGHSIPHLVLHWSLVPVRLFSKSRGFCLVQAQGNVPRGQDPALWRSSMDTDIIPVVAGELAWQPDGKPAALLPEGTLLEGAGMQRTVGCC